MFWQSEGLSSTENVLRSGLVGGERARHRLNRYLELTMLNVLITADCAWSSVRTTTQSEGEVR